MRQCLGCGGTLQNTDQSKPFYTPKPLDTEETLLCQRCFRIRHYGEVIPSQIEEHAFLKIIESLAGSKSLIVMVIDLFDLEASILPQLKRLSQSDDILVVANKRDLLPKSVNDARLKHRVMKRLHAHGLKPLDIVIVSAIKRFGIDACLDAIITYAKHKDIVFVGASNAGKSTLINCFLDATQDQSNHRITVSSTPATTQGLIPVPFENNVLYDTPGLLVLNHPLSLLDAEMFKPLQPQREIKPKTCQLSINQTVFVSGLLRLDIIKGDPANITVYASDAIRIHRRKTDQASAFYANHVGSLLTPPKGLVTCTLTPHDMRFEAGEELVIPGVAFITFKQKTTTRVFTPKPLMPYRREALIG